MIKDNALTKEKLLTLTDIDPKSIEGMTKSQLSAYVQALNVTASAYPLQKEELLFAFSEMDYATLFQWLEIIGSSLSQMHADDLAAECSKHININKDLDNIRPTRVKVFIDYFIPTLDLFFSDIHKVLEELEVVEPEPQTEESSPVKIIEKLLTISELDSGIIKSMPDEDINDYLWTLNNYHTEFQAQDNGLRGSIKIRHYVFVMQWLNTIQESLIKIHATELAEDVGNQIAANKDFNNIRHEKLEVYVNYLLSSLSMLSADIKMLHLPKKVEQAGKKDVPEHIAVEVELLSPGSTPDAKTIFIVNKMTMFMNSFKNALGDIGHKLIGVTTAEAALGYLKTSKPDLFIIDEDLPKTDSIVFTKVIRATGHLAPIIFTTSKITKDKMVKFMEVGVADFIMKPITPADVQKKVTKHLP